MKSKNSIEVQKKIFFRNSCRLCDKVETYFSRTGHR